MFASQGERQNFPRTPERSLRTKVLEQAKEIEVTAEVSLRLRELLARCAHEQIALPPSTHARTAPADSENCFLFLRRATHDLYVLDFWHVLNTDLLSMIGLFRNCFPLEVKNNHLLLEIHGKLFELGLSVPYNLPVEGYPRPGAPYSPDY